MEVGEQERNGVGHRRVRRVRVGYVNGAIGKKSKKCCRRAAGMRVIKRSGGVAAPEDPTALQKLFVSCQGVFKGPGTVPSPHDVQKLCRILGTFLG